ncbi:hypothetical protein [Embleya sp. MST-111070]|uniref:hypothetical protein n=1 Tax=Embleya sp. MST-111070 TaxID=3398231 RepID=UPI003F734B7A
MTTNAHHDDPLGRQRPSPAPTKRKPHARRAPACAVRVGSALFVRTWPGDGRVGGDVPVGPPVSPAAAGGA